jgi:uncharacterized RDD family membrane protein YckC
VLDRVYVVSTPENLELRFERGGLATRAAALAIDVASIAVLQQVAAWLLLLFGGAGSLGAALWIVAAFAAQWWYGSLCEWQKGCTLGKWLVGLMVVDSHGLRPSLLQAAARNLLRLVDFLPGLHLVGAVVCLLDPFGRRLGDLAAQTVVVRRARTREPAPPADTPHEQQTPPYVEALALRLEPRERSTVHTLVGALESLPLALRFQLCERLETHLCARHGVQRPPEPSSERVLSLVEAALRQSSDSTRS